MAAEERGCGLVDILTNISCRMQLMMKSPYRFSMKEKRQTRHWTESTSLISNSRICFEIGRMQRFWLSRKSMLPAVTSLKPKSELKRLPRTWWITISTGFCRMASNLRSSQIPNWRLFITRPTSTKPLPPGWSKSRTERIGMTI